MKKFMIKKKKKKIMINIVKHVSKKIIFYQNKLVINYKVYIIYNLY